MAFQETASLGEVGVVMMFLMVLTGARTELTEKTPLVVLVAKVVPDPAWTSPPSPFPPSSSLLAKEEDMVATEGAEEEESLWTRPVPRLDCVPGRDTAEEQEEVTSLGLASSYWR